MSWKKGDIGVRIDDYDKHDYGQNKGDIVECLEDDSRFHYSSCASSLYFRKATPTEIEAYKNGIRNIKDIFDITKVCVKGDGDAEWVKEFFEGYENRHGLNFESCALYFVDESNSINCIGECKTHTLITKDQALKIIEGRKHNKFVDELTHAYDTSTYNAYTLNCRHELQYIDTPPKYWCVKMENMEQVKLVVNCINSIYGMNWGCNKAKLGNYMGFDGNCNHNGTNWYEKIERFKNNPVEITWKQYKQYFLNNKTDNNGKIKNEVSNGNPKLNGIGKESTCNIGEHRRRKGLQGVFPQDEQATIAKPNKRGRRATSVVLYPRRDGSLSR